MGAVLALREFGQHLVARPRRKPDTVEVTVRHRPVCGPEESFLPPAPDWYADWLRRSLAARGWYDDDRLNDLASAVVDAHRNLPPGRVQELTAAARPAITTSDLPAIGGNP